jgi:hypothetical protein
MASGAFAHDDGQYVPEVSRLFIGQVRFRARTVRQSQGDREAPERGSRERSKKTRAFCLIHESTHDYFGVNPFWFSTRSF